MIRLDSVLAIRTTVSSGEKLGSQLFLVGPLFTTPGGHGTEIMRSLPDTIRDQVDAQFLRLPKRLRKRRNRSMPSNEWVSMALRPSWNPARGTSLQSPRPRDPQRYRR